MALARSPGLGPKAIALYDPGLKPSMILLHTHKSLIWPSHIRLKDRVGRRLVLIGINTMGKISQTPMSFVVDGQEKAGVHSLRNSLKKTKSNLSISSRSARSTISVILRDGSGGRTKMNSFFESSSFKPAPMWKIPHLSYNKVPAGPIPPNTTFPKSF